MIKFDKDEFLKQQIYSTNDEYEARCNVTIEIVDDVKQLQKENQEYKEVIDKLKELIIDNIEETTYEYIGSNRIKVLQKLIMDNEGVNELLYILKEVE